MGHVLSVHQSGSDPCLTKAIGFAPNAFCDGFVPHRVLARGLQFNPQALDACQTMTVFSGRGTLSQRGSMRQNEQINCPLCSYADRARSGFASAAPSGTATHGRSVQRAEFERPRN
jgi:hypothetical protein